MAMPHLCHHTTFPTPPPPNRKENKLENHPQIPGIGVLGGWFGRKNDGFRFLVYLMVFAHLPGKPIYLPFSGHLCPQAVCAPKRAQILGRIVYLESLGGAKASEPPEAGVMDGSHGWLGRGCVFDGMILWEWGEHLVGGQLPLFFLQTCWLTKERSLAEKRKHAG